MEKPTSLFNKNMDRIFNKMNCSMKFLSRPKWKFDNFIKYMILKNAIEILNNFKLVNGRKLSYAQSI